ncbi:MAG TPA: trehalase family glycosidase [Puia sp.]
MKRCFLIILLFPRLFVSAQYSRNTFANLLDLHNSLPAGHIVQTSAMVFSDMGAWHGYALPANAAEAGGFNGPVLFNDLGLVLSPCFARLSLTVDGQDYEFEHSRQVYYPGMLLQEYTNDGVELSQSLVFSDARSAIIRVKIINHSGKIRHAGISFAGTLNPHTGVLKAAGKKITAQLTKGIFTSEIITGLGIKTTATDSSYISAATSPVTLAPGGTLVIYIKQSNFLDAADLSGYRSPADVDLEGAFAGNRQRWDGYISRAFHHKTGWLNDPVYRRLAVKAIITLMTNWRSAAGAIRHDGIFPTYNYFDGFWAWDSWKHAAACALFAPGLAKDNIRCMFDYQDKEGMIADCVFIDTTRNNYRNTKPPLAAWAVWEVYRQTGDRDFVREMYPKLLGYHAWWYTHRDHDHNGLCEYGSNNGEAKAAAWESGMDNAVRFDSAVLLQNGPAAWSFDQESVDLNSFLYLEKVLLAKMAVLLDDHAKAKELLSAAHRLKLQINDLMYDSVSGFYYDIRIGNKTRLTLKGPEGWEPLWTGLASPAAADAVKRAIMDTAVFNTYLPFPSFQADQPRFDARAYWRGPVWFDQAMFAVEGLKRYGKDDVAAALQRKLFQHARGLLGDGAIRETYDPLTGEGITAVNFSWSAASILRLLLLR